MIALKEKLVKTITIREDVKYNFLDFVRKGGGVPPKF